MRLLMLGDSHLARLGPGETSRLERGLTAEVDNAAVGGAWSGDLRRQIGKRHLRRYDALVLSIGTNDAHPSIDSSAQTLRDNLVELLAEAPPTTFLISPGMRQAPIPFETDAVNVAIGTCMDAAVDVVAAHQGQLVPTVPILECLRDAAWDPDGMHLSHRANGLAMAALVSALRDT